MQIVTFFSSARPTTCLSASAQFFNPSASSIPSRLPEKQITLGKPASLVASIDLRILPRHSSQFSLRLSPLVMPCEVVIVPTRLFFFRFANQSGPTRSMPYRPSLTALAQNSSCDQLLKHHWQ